MGFKRTHRRLYKNLVLTGFIMATAMLTVIIMMSYKAEGYPVQSPTGIDSLEFYKTIDCAYFNEQYYSDFDSYHDLTWILEGQANIIDETANSRIRLKSTLASTRAWVDTDCIYLGWSDYYNHGVTIIELEFEPLSNDYDGWMEDNDEDGYYETHYLYTIISGPGFGLHLKDDRRLYLSDWWDVGQAIQRRVIDEQLMQMNKDQKYTISILVRNTPGDTMRTIGVYVDNVKKKWWNVNYLGTDTLGTVIGFGDPSSQSHADEPKGEARWYSLLVKGHNNMRARFFDNFNDDGATNWRKIELTVDDSDWDVTLNGELHLDSSVNLNDKCNGQSPFIDYYDSNEPYLITFDFKYTSNEDEFVVMSNNELMVIIEQGTLKYIRSDETTTSITNLNTNQWYYIRIWKLLGEDPEDDDYFKVWVDRTL